MFLTSQIGPSSSASLSTHPSKENAYSTSASGNTTGYISSDPSLGNLDLDDIHHGADIDKQIHSGDMIEIWDVRREWIAKWRVLGSGREGGVTGKCTITNTLDIAEKNEDLDFADSHALWVSHPSGAFSQMDLRYCEKPIDAVPRVAITWNPTASFTFVTSKAKLWEVPYDDVYASRTIFEIYFLSHEAGILLVYKRLAFKKLSHIKGWVIAHSWRRSQLVLFSTHLVQITSR